MYGFIVTTHYENYTIIKKCLDILIHSIPENSFIILYINETKCDKVLNIKNEYLNKNFNKLETIYIDNQKLNNGLTGTWNQGIDYLLNKKDFECKVITILGHDTYINKDIIHLLQGAKEAQNSSQLKYFGPLCKSNKYTGINLWQDYKVYNKHKLEYLTGFLLTFPIYSLLNNRLKNGLFFDNNYPFAANEVEWYNRFNKIGGKPILCTNCIINHDHNRSWINFRNDNPISKNEVNYVEKKIQDLKFNWKDYIKKNPDLRTIGTEQKAINHYLTKGQYQGRKY